MLTRPMIAGDISSVIALLRKYEGTTFFDWENAEVIGAFLDRCPRQAYVTEDNGSVIACAFLGDGLVGLLHHVQVHPDYRGRGVATTLVQTLLRDFFTRTHVRRIQALVLGNNPVALAFWKKFGMKQSSAGGGSIISFYLDLKQQSWLKAQPCS